MAQEVSGDVVDKYGIIQFKPGSETDLDYIVEKPDKGAEPSRMASYGRYLLTPEIFDYLVPTNVGKDAELWTVDAITKIAAQKRVMVAHTKGEWMTTGDPENYFHAHVKFVMEQEMYGSKVSSWITEFQK